MNNNKLVICMTAVTSLVCGVAIAQTSPAPQPGGSTYGLSGTSISGSNKSSALILTAPVNPDAAPIKTETGVYFYPSVSVGAGHNDNLRLTSSNQISSNFLTVSPSVVAELKRRGDRYTAQASLSNTTYASSSSDNTLNSNIGIAGDNYFTSRARAGWALGVVNGTDPRGSTQRTASANPDRWRSTNADARFIYGAPEAQGRMELDLGLRDKVYTNNRINTAVADVNGYSVAARAYYRVGTRTMALAEFRDAKANYPSALATDSNTERRYYAGLTWDATAATTGIVKVGRMTKDFDLSSRQGYSGGSWEATARWLPRTYSAFDLKTARATADSTGVGIFTLNTSTDLVWSHKWSQTLSSRVSAGVLSTDFAGTARSDKAKNFGFAVDYALARWVRFGVDVATTNNSSSAPDFTYKRNIFMLTLNASL